MAPTVIDYLVTQLPEFIEGSDVDAYVESVSSSIVMLKPWMHPMCRVWIRARDCYRKISRPEKPEYVYEELIGLPWRVALAVQSKGLYLYTCLAMKPEDKAFDHEYLFFFKATAQPHSVEYYHREVWPIEGITWLEKIVAFSPIMTSFYDPYQDQKIKEFVKKNNRRWLGEE